MKKAAANLTGIIFSICLIIIALITAFEVSMYSDFSYYEKEYSKYCVIYDLNMTMEDTMEVTHYMMSYLRGNEDELSIVTTVEGEEKDFFNEQDRFHMGEVRDLFIGGLHLRTGAIMIGILCLVILLALKENLLKVLPKMYQITVAFFLVVCGVLGTMFAVDFDRCFVTFHHIFFDNDQWIFDPRYDYMIRMLPEGLFYDFAMKIGLLFVEIMVILLVISIAICYMNRKKR